MEDTLKIIDCFTFYNELDLLNYRLNILNEVVDYFIIVEATHTHIGNEKKLLYNENKHLFEKFQNKIIHIIVDDFPYKYQITNGKDQWVNENFQRNSIIRGLNQLKLEDQDIIIISDLDEIADPSTLQKIKNKEVSVTVNTLDMQLYYYNLNSKFDFNWRLCKIISYKKYKELNYTCEMIRQGSFPSILNGGWHLSYFGDSLFIKNKIEQFAHQEYNNNNYTDLNKIEDRVNNCSDLYDRNYNKLQKISVTNNTYLPPEYNVYLTKFYTF
jgi:beta-1,4-mannosyl-glycoprotein beta-1,4-N-acetylglucosaminyltransferase